MDQGGVGHVAALLSEPDAADGEPTHSDREHRRVGCEANPGRRVVDPEIQGAEGNATRRLREPVGAGRPLGRVELAAHSARLVRRGSGHELELAVDGPVDPQLASYELERAQDAASRVHRDRHAVIAPAEGP